MSPILPLALASAPAAQWEDGGVIALKLLAVLALVALNGFFVAAEFARVKVRSSQLDSLVQEGHRRAKLAQHITGRLDAYLSACQLGITLASLGLGWLGEPFLAQIIEPLAIQMGLGSPGIIHGVSFAVGF